jgi:hypothetical protein
MLRKLFIAALLTSLFLLVLLVAGTAQNDGCLPWQEPLRVGGGVFSEDRGETVCR